MNRDQLLKAIGDADEAMLRETELLRNAPGSTSKLTEITKAGRPARRRLIIVLAACMVLALGSVAAYASGIFRNSGSVTTGQDPEGNATYFFEPNEDMRLPLTAFTGDVTNSTAYMYEYWQRSRGVEFSYPDRRNGTLGISTDCTLPPFEHVQNFDTMEDAAAYIGYDKIVIPGFVQDNTPDWIYVCALGSDDNWIPDTDIEPDFELGCVSINAKYYFSDMFIILTDYMISEAAPEPRAVQLVTAPNTQLTPAVEVMNDRAFQVITEDHPAFDPGYVQKEYIWAEDKVEYHLTIRYRADEQDKANTVIYDWMNSFGK